MLSKRTDEDVDVDVDMDVVDRRNGTEPEKSLAKIRPSAKVCFSTSKIARSRSQGQKDLGCQEHVRSGSGVR